MFKHSNYRLNYLKDNFDFRELKNGYIVLKHNEGWIDFAVLEFSYSDNSGEFLSCFWHGSGPSEGLRECRHSYFGTPPNPHNDEEGIDSYVFYINGKLVTEAFEVLSEYFDDMKER